MACASDVYGLKADSSLARHSHRRGSFLSFSFFFFFFFFFFWASHPTTPTMHRRTPHSPLLLLHTPHPPPPPTPSSLCDRSDVGPYVYISTLRGATLIITNNPRGFKRDQCCIYNLKSRADQWSRGGGGRLKYKDCEAWCISTTSEFIVRLVVCAWRLWGARSRRIYCVKVSWAGVCPLGPERRLRTHS